MSHPWKVSLPALILIAAILACNTPVEQVPPPEEIQTAAALTLQVIFTPAVSPTSATPFVKNTITPLITGTSSAVGSPTVTITPTYSVPMLTVKESTNCRTGPGENYDVVFTYLAGKQLEIVGRYDPGNFWLVKSNESPTGTCWLWGQYADVDGSYWTVASVTPPPTATSAPPRGPGIVKWEFFCSGGTLTFNVTWADNAKDETGYRVFRNGEQAAELPADSTSYTDNVAVSGDQSMEYYIQVYSPTGTANSSVMRMKCS
jgi:SH3 domain protein